MTAQARISGDDMKRAKPFCPHASPSRRATTARLCGPAMANTAQDGNGSPPRPGTDGKRRTT